MRLAPAGQQSANMKLPILLASAILLSCNQAKTASAPKPRFTSFAEDPFRRVDLLQLLTGLECESPAMLLTVVNALSPTICCFHTGEAAYPMLVCRNLKGETLVDPNDEDMAQQELRPQM